jgi:hypothetical protein
MRVSSLSDDRVIRLISKHFVPAWFSRDHYQREAAPEQDAEMDRIGRVAAAHKMSHGAVCVFIVDPTGDVIGSLMVQPASDPEKLLPFLNELIEKHHIGVRSAEASRATTAGPRKPPALKKENGHLFSIYCQYTDTIGRTRGLSHDWVELSPVDWAGFMPSGPVKEGDVWTVPDAVSRALLKYSYPPIPHWKVSESRIRNVQLKATVATLTDDREVPLWIEGNVNLVYPEKGSDPGVTTATFSGLCRIERATGKIKMFKLISEKALYTIGVPGKLYPRPIRIAVEME